jgi:hypothetical protein
VSDDLSIPNPGYRGHRTPRYGATAERRPAMDADTRRLALFAGGIGGILAILIVASMITNRHGSGPIPVISPDPSPMRVRPDNPGGMKIDTTAEEAMKVGGIANARLGPAAEMPDAPPPAARVAAKDANHAEVGHADVARADVARADAARADVGLGHVDTDHADTGASSIAPAADQPTAPAARSLLGAADAMAVKPLPAPKPVVLADAFPAKPAEPAAAKAPPAAPAKSLLAAAASPAKPPPPKPVAEADPHPAAAHAVMVQLAAMPTDASARDEWLRLSRRFPDLFGGRDLSISRSDHDTHVFWRVRTGGFTDIAQARAFCDALRAKGAGCSIVEF